MHLRRIKYDKSLKRTNVANQAVRVGGNDKNRRDPVNIYLAGHHNLTLHKLQKIAASKPQYSLQPVRSANTYGYILNSNLSRTRRNLTSCYPHTLICQASLNYSRHRGIIPNIIVNTKITMAIQKCTIAEDSGGLPRFASTDRRGVENLMQFK